MAKDYHFREWRVRADMVAALEKYINYGYPLGDFLQAVVSNDLKEACNRADEDNLRNLPAFIGYLYNVAPMACSGSRRHYKDWLEQHTRKREESSREELP